MLVKVVGALVLLIVFVVLVGVLFTLPAMLIWNAYVVSTFGAPVLGFWQTFWLLVLSKIVFSTASASAK